ncbi:hypothetical protein N7445_004512 [Penicillium cf. griseofulvum]|nr:hypothetical protein N7445_004512 [Penicillium cf. griseofulvum]
MAEAQPAPVLKK